MQGKALPGFRDFYPEELALRNHIFAVWRSVARRYGFEEYDGPPLEPLEIYTQKSGEEIVEQLYAFEDKGGRKVALRPEMTPTLARMVGERLLTDALRADRARVRPVLEFMSGLRDGAAELRESAAAEPLNECVQRLGAMGLGPFVEVDFTIVRGLAYYTGIVFELFDQGRSLRAICGGGRYDDLIKAIAGVDLPCVGFGMGDVVLGALLKDRAKQPEPPAPLDAFLDAVSGEDVEPVLKLAHELRDQGVAVEYGLRHAAIRKQLELAAARGAPRAVIVGPDERAASEVVVRDLNAGTEEKVPVARLLNGFFR